MKKLSILILALFLGMAGFAQKKSGTVYSEHKYIDKTRELWQAFADLNKEGVLELVADTVYNYNNGNLIVQPKENFANVVNWWKNVDNLQVEDYPSTKPHVIEYNDEELWSEIWLLVTGVHNETGINMEIMLHNMCKYDDDGKLLVFVQEYNNDIFQKITENLTVSENGTMYKNHPYITTVRKIINAHASSDIEKWESFYAPNASFSNSTMKPGTWLTRDEVKENIKKWYANDWEFDYKETGYPDCIHYNQGDSWTVMSWWIVTVTNKDGSSFEYPLHFHHNFNKEGKVISVYAYYSNNHFE